MKNIPIRQIKATHKTPQRLAGFCIRDVRELLMGKPMVQELHRHDFFHVLVLKKGAGHHTIDFTPYAVGDQSVFIIRPGQVHALTLQAGSTGYLMEFRHDFYRPHDKVSRTQFRRATATNFYPPHDSGFKKLLAILRSTFEEYANQEDGYQEVIRANLGILFVELVRQQGNASSTGITTYTQERLEELLELIETDVAGHKDVAHYAERLNLSAYQLNAITRTTLGKTCSELIDEYIILESKRYLLATSNLVNQVAAHLGYDDASYFIRFFKKHTGHSPEAFRNNSR